MKKKLFYCIYAAWLLIVLILFGEICCRTLLKGRFNWMNAGRADEEILPYRYDKELGWFPVKNSEKICKARRRIKARHNRNGFRDHEYGPKEKTRILFLGDSFVWGNDVEREERFTEQLQKRLPRWEVLNLGVSGYSTYQEYLLLRKYFPVYRPDMVFLVFCFNDRSDNQSNVDAGYYKPYFIMDKGKVVPAGIPVPKSENYYYGKYLSFSKSYLLNILLKVACRAANPKIKVPDNTNGVILAAKELVVSGGAEFVLVLTVKDGELERFCDENGIKYMHAGTAETYPSHGWHWTPRGHQQVSDQIYEYLRENGYAV